MEPCTQDMPCRQDVSALHLGRGCVRVVAGTAASQPARGAEISGWIVSRRLCSATTAPGELHLFPEWHSEAARHHWPLWGASPVCRVLKTATHCSGHFSHFSPCCDLLSRPGWCYHSLGLHGLLVHTVSILSFAGRCSSRRSWCSSIDPRGCGYGSSPRTRSDRK